MKLFSDNTNPKKLLYILFGVWWVANLIQAGFSELANDEAYYYIFAQDLSWGYFDHPPMTALLVWLGSIFGGEFGVRVFFTILQPVYLLLFFNMIKPKDVTVKDVTLYFVICAALPIMQLYGFIAVPDAPLMLFTALFLLTYIRFVEKDSWLNTALMGLTMAGLAYSKYHGAFVVFFTLISNPKIFKNSKLYVSGMFALLLITPHLMWQNDHDWASFRYHLTDRNKSFRFDYITEFLMNLLLVFNPLFWPIYIQAARKKKVENPLDLALGFITIGFILFFTFSSIRGYVQPQWVIPITFGLIAILFRYVREHRKTRKYVMISGLITIGLIVLIRLVMIFNPIGIKYEVFNNKPSYGKIAEIADGKTVVFRGSYAIASKYIFYTGKDAYCQPAVDYRTSQWQYYDQDTKAAGKSVVLQTRREFADSTVTLANGMEFSYKIVDNFRPVRKVAITAVEGLTEEIESGENKLPKHVVPGQKFDLALKIENPYNYEIAISPDSLPLVMVWRDMARKVWEFPMDVTSSITPEGSLTIRLFTLVSDTLPKGKYQFGFAVKPDNMEYWYNSKPVEIEVK